MFTSGRFQSGSKLQRVAASIFATFMMLYVAPALASDTQTNADAVPRSVHNLDLCTLVYQLYHQSLCLPLDPWYDIMSRVGSDRRDNICRFTHEYATVLGDSAGYYSGPNSARGWKNSNLNLDPILTNYKQIDAKLPTFNRDGEMFLTVKAPDYVTSKIKTIEGVRYKTKPNGYPYSDVERFPIRDYPGGTDHLIVFEGGTGITGATEPAWSLMGFVLMQKTRTGYDAHIVFRGSRSGSALSKTVWKAQDFIGNAKGNPDWVTDLDGSKQITQPLISKVGTVTKGFAESLPTMLGPIAACCKHLEQNYPAPEHIFVTGHSLGAGLATQFVSAVLQGSYGEDLRKEVKSWPWDATTLMAYAQPIPGDPAWAASFDKLSPTSEHYWVSGDSVVEATSGRIVGLFIDKGEHAGIQKKLSSVANCNDNPHEVFVIRSALLRDLAPGDATLSQQLGSENTWAYYDSFSKMLAGQPRSYVHPGAPAPKIVTDENLHRILQNGNFSTEYENWLEAVYARMIADKSSYIGPKFQSTLDERKKLVLDLVQKMRAPVNSNAQELDGLEATSALIDDNLGLAAEEQWIYTGTILSRFQKTSLTIPELLSKPAIKTCLDAKIDSL
ncbi:MAG: hypothetical protein JSS86_24370 [Cyanobacteria bacterium SZAS LIN-2]|nr:hypothetical protein [Cyanobacteria bacterium SZAS LIN-2]